MAQLTPVQLQIAGLFQKMAPLLAVKETMSPALDRLSTNVVRLEQITGRLLMERQKGNIRVNSLSDEIKHLESENASVTSQHNEYIVRVQQKLRQQTAKIKTALEAKQQAETEMEAKIQFAETRCLGISSVGNSDRKREPIIIEHQDLVRKTLKFNLDENKQLMAEGLNEVLSSDTVARGLAKDTIASFGQWDSSEEDFQHIKQVLDEQQMNPDTLQLPPAYITALLLELHNAACRGQGSTIVVRYRLLQDDRREYYWIRLCLNEMMEAHVWLEQQGPRKFKRSRLNPPGVAYESKNAASADYKDEFSKLMRFVVSDAGLRSSTVESWYKNNVAETSTIDVIFNEGVLGNFERVVNFVKEGINRGGDPPVLARMMPSCYLLLLIHNDARVKKDDGRSLREKLMSTQGDGMQLVHFCLNAMQTADQTQS